MDMANTDALQKALAQLMKNGPVDILVNNTGGPPPGLAHEADTATFADAFRLHLLSYQTLVRAVVPHMKEQKSGPYGITVNNVLPGATGTERLAAIVKNKATKSGTSEDAASTAMKNEIPLRRFAEPEEIAYAVAFLAGPSGAYVNGINLPVDGGRTACL